MKKGLFNRRMPTIIALLILTVIVGISTFLIQSGIFYVGKAAPDTQPQNFGITNITDTSFTVTFSTTGLVDAVLSISAANTGSSITLDDRDKKSGAQNKYYSHHISVPNLSPETTYVFKLIIGGKEYQESTYAVKTGRTISAAPPTQNPLFGKVLLPNGTPGGDTIVTATTSQSGVVSAVTDAQGEFIIPTNSIRNTAGSEYFLLQNQTVFNLRFFHQSMNATVDATFDVAQNLPPVTLLQQYAFLGNTQEQTATNEISQLNFVDSNATAQTVTIKKPLQGEEFIDQRPIFSGTSFPNSSVDIQIPGVAQQQILTRADGSWTFQTPNNIPQGNHTITISVIDPTNKKVTDSRRFTIFPLGSQVTESATPSATPAFRPTATPTRIPPTPTVKPSVSPTLSPPSPTPTIIVATSTPILTPTPTVAISTPTSLPTIYFTPTTQPTINAPGAFENTAVLTGLSVVLIIAGIALLFAL